MGATSDERGTGAGGLDWYGLPSAAAVRVTAGLLLAAVAAVVGALILGEYALEGATAVGAGALFGFVVAEITVGIGRRRTVGVGIAAAALAAGGLAWGGWIEAGEGLAPIGGWSWVAVAIGAAVALLAVTGLRPGRRPGEHS